MSALDDNSYIVSEPLHMPPIRNNPVFQSSKYPIVKLPTSTPTDFMDIDDKDDSIMCVNMVAGDHDEESLMEQATCSVIDISDRNSIVCIIKVFAKMRCQGDIY